MFGLKRCPGWAWLRSGLGLFLGLVWLCQPTRVIAICGLQAAILEQLRSVQNRDAALVWSQQISQRRGGLCSLCHVFDYGPRNRYGSALDLLLTGNDREDSLRKREAGRRVSEIPADPAFPDSPTFGDLIRQGFPPASVLTRDLLASRNLVAKPSLEITVQQAKELVQQVEGESRFGILQLSGTYEISPEVAEAIAGFRGEMLILGLKSLSPEVAQALAKSQAATVWLHSMTSVTPEAAEAIARVPGYLVLSGLVELDSVPLAEKLAGRPGVLSFPYLKSLTPETATTLGRNSDALNLGGMTDASREVQDRLAEAAGPLTMPSLTSLDSLPLTKKLAAGYAQSVLLPEIKTLSVEQAEEIASLKRNLFFGGTMLPMTVMSEEVATVFSKHPEAGRLELMGREISGASLRILSESQLSIGLLELDSLSFEQVEILATAPDSVPGGPFGTRAKFHLPNLKRLDSALLAITLLRCSREFGGVTYISPEAAAALASVPNREVKYPNGAVRVLPPYGLSFPNLEELPPETAQLLMTRPWSAIALPALQDVSLETVRSLARQTSHLTLGLTTLPPEFASAFGEMASNEFDLGGGSLNLPYLKDLSPEAARILVSSLNRGSDDNVGGLNRAPQLYIGGHPLIAFSAEGLCPPLTAELAAELAKYRGRLSIANLQDLSPQAAAELVAFRGPSLGLFGPATDNLSPETAAALAEFSGNLQMSLRVLNSAPLAAKFARQSSRTLDELEFISADAIPAYVQYRGFFTLRQLPVLDSPELASRLIQDSTGQVMPSLRTITPAAAEVLATSPNAIFLGLEVIDDPAVALALVRSQKGVSLPRLRAATPSVVAILREAHSITTPPLDSLYLLIDDQTQ